LSCFKFGRYSVEDSRLIPWQDVNSWFCNACGICCLGYRVPLRIDEYAKIAGQYGYETVEFDLGKVYLKRALSNRCLFQRNWGGRWLCTIQGMKPLACMLYPFRVSKEPKHTRESYAYFKYRGVGLYIYLDPHCPGIKLGTPDQDFLNRTLPEILEISLGLTRRQHYSTDYKVPIQRNLI